MKASHRLIFICALACALGFAFAALSTYDFIAHLDRQVHGIHCSFLPGLSAADSSGETGCHATLMSPYSSVFRQSIWGGIPVALPAMAVFAFLGFFCIWLILSERGEDGRATGLLLLGSLVPLLTSLVMGYISLVELDAACKLCIGIYASSALLSLGASLLWIRARRGSSARAEQVPERVAAQTPRSTTSLALLALVCATGLFTVAVTVGAYAATAPDFSSFVGKCGQIAVAKAERGVLVPYGPQKGRTNMLEVMDPLCPSCRAFEERLIKMDAVAKVDRQLLLFPLDAECNWMIDRSIHPGACTVSKAVLCADDPAGVIAWAFENQTAILASAERDSSAASRLVSKRFPELSACIAGAEVEAKLNQSLRFAVKHRLEVLTPQVFVDGLRLCGEDTDLGLDFALPRLIDMAQQATPSPGGLPPEPSTRPAVGPKREQSEGARNVAGEPTPKADPIAEPTASSEAASASSDRRKALAAQLERQAAGEQPVADDPASDTVDAGEPSALSLEAPSPARPQPTPEPPETTEVPAQEESQP